jgi:hypothetical protein
MEPEQLEAELLNAESTLKAAEREFIAEHRKEYKPGQPQGVTAAK